MRPQRNSGCLHPTTPSRQRKANSAPQPPPRSIKPKHQNRLKHKDEQSNSMVHAQTQSKPISNPNHPKAVPKPFATKKERKNKLMTHWHMLDNIHSPPTSISQTPTPRVTRWHHLEITQPLSYRTTSHDEILNYTYSQTDSKPQTVLVWFPFHPPNNNYLFPFPDPTQGSTLATA